MERLLKLMCVMAACAAAAVSADPEFEVVSIRPAPRLTLAMAQSGQLRSRMDDGGVSFSNITLMTLITISYGTSPALVSGPGWLDDQSFAVEAKLPAGATKEQIPAMLRGMLEDRFKLKVHHTPRTEQVYMLTIGKQGIKFKKASGDMPADQKGCSGRPGHTRCRSVTLAGWADGVSAQARMFATMPAASSTERRIDLPVVDETGLTALYDFDLEWIPEDGGGRGRGGAIEPPSGSTKATSIFQAIEAIGLKLEPGKHTYDTLVVDHAEKTPTEN